MDSRKILDYFEQRQTPTTDLISEIVEIESPSHDNGASSILAEFLETRFREIDPSAAVERCVVDDGVHLIIKVFPGDQRPALLLGHTDTVHPVGSKKINPTRIEGSLFYGCGIFDMKANIAIASEVLRFFVNTGQRPARPITFLLSCDEEVGSRTGRRLVENEAAQSAYCLVLEPSADGKVKTGRKGTGMYGLVAHGRPAHAGLEPDKGANAIVELAKQIPRVHSFADPAVGTTVNVTTVKGGTASNVIPEFAECQIDVRFSKTSEAERVDGGLRGLDAFDGRISLELYGAINRPPMERTADVVSLFQKSKELAATYDYVLEETQVGGASDGNFVAALGVPLLDGLGVRGAGAHMMTEHIQVNDIAPRATLITLLLQNL